MNRRNKFTSFNEIKCPGLSNRPIRLPALFFYNIPLVVLQYDIFFSASFPGLSGLRFRGEKSGIMGINFPAFNLARGNRIILGFFNSDLLYSVIPVRAQPCNSLGQTAHETAEKSALSALQESSVCDPAAAEMNISGSKAAPYAAARTDL